MTRIEARYLARIAYFMLVSLCVLAVTPDAYSKPATWVAASSWVALLGGYVVWVVANRRGDRP